MIEKLKGLNKSHGQTFGLLQMKLTKLDRKLDHLFSKLENIMEENRMKILHLQHEEEETDHGEDDDYKV